MWYMFLIAKWIAFKPETLLGWASHDASWEVELFIIRDFILCIFLETVFFAYHFIDSWCIVWKELCVLSAGVAITKETDAISAPSEQKIKQI